MAALGWALALGAASPCTQAPALDSPRPEAAAAYRAVGAEELSQGRRPSAAAAFRMALGHSPEDLTARQGLAKACAEQPSAPVLLDEAMAAMAKEEWEAALQALSGGPLGPSDPSAALLMGICHYELGHGQIAQELLQRASAHPVQRDAAQLYLGLIALRAGDGSRAARHLGQVGPSSDVQLSAALGELSRLARRDGRLAVALSAQAGLDGNADLLPDSASELSEGHDATGALEALALARPLGRSGPFALARGQYRKLLRRTAFDTGAIDAVLGYAHAPGQAELSASYGFDLAWVGGLLHRDGHRLQASVRHPAGPLELEGAYSGRAGRLFDSQLAGYSGLRHLGEALVQWPRPAFSLGAGYRVEVERTADPGFAYLEHAALLLARLTPRPPLALELELSAGSRQYEEDDPWLGLVRADARVEGAFSASYELADRWTVQAVLTARKVLSNAEAFTHTRFTGSLGLTYSAGLL